MLFIKQLSTTTWLPPAGWWQKPPGSSHRARYNHTMSSVWCWLPLRSWKHLCRAFPARLPTAVPSPYCLYYHPSDQTPKSRAALLSGSVKGEFSLPLGASPDPQLLMLLLQRALQLVRVFFPSFCWGWWANVSSGSDIHSVWFELIAHYFLNFNT